MSAWSGSAVVAEQPERAGAFRLGGDVDRAFDFGVERLLIAIESPRGS